MAEIEQLIQTINCDFWRISLKDVMKGQSSCLLQLPIKLTWQVEPQIVYI